MRRFLADTGVEEIGTEDDYRWQDGKRDGPDRAAVERHGLAH
jgi:hypothetical protein